MDFGKLTSLEELIEAIDIRSIRRKGRGVRVGSISNILGALFLV